MLAYFLNKLPDSYKIQIKLNFLTNIPAPTQEKIDWKAWLDNNLDSKIAREIHSEPWGFNYMEKIRWGLENGCEYSMKLDEDCLFNESVWTYMIDNLSILDKGNILFLSPALSIGIPTVEMFMVNHFTKEEQDEMYRIFLSTTMLDRWGVDYSSLNAFTTGAKEWHHHEYYGAVGKINHPYKGVHPVRQSYRAQKLMFKFLLNKIEQFKAPQDYKIEIAKYPYFCNSVFIIRTNMWNRIVNDQSLYCDSFEEVPLNRYCDIHNMKQAFISNAFGIHTKYNDAIVDEETKNDNPAQSENDFYAEFERRVCI